MRLLLDENTPKTIVEGLRNCGYDLLWIREYCRGMADEDIVRLSMSDDRVILTFDKDFGELIYRQKMNTPGIILTRIANNQSAKERIIELLKNHGDKLIGYFIVLTEKRIRRRRL